MAWVKEPPYVPNRKKTSVYYWYWDTKENAMWPTEIYEGIWKLYVYKGLWWDQPIEPPESPREDTKTDEKNNA